jgi:phosphohistidine phosphatase SixA
MDSRSLRLKRIVTVACGLVGGAACGDDDGSGGGATGGTTASTTTASTTTTSATTTSATGAGGTGVGGAGGDAGSGGAGGGTPSGLMAAVNDTLVELTWSSPDPSSGNTVVRVVRSLNAPPSGPDDPNGTVVYEGPAEAATEPTSALLPDMPDAPRTYHYAAYGCTPAQTCETTGSSTTLTLTLTEALVGGGYNVIWRHASADVCSDNLSLGTVATTTTPDWWKSCESNCAIATARQLNATGVMEATAIGQDLASLGVPFGRVLSSEFCRNIQTAELMNLGPTIEERLEITYFVYDEANRCTNTQTLLTLPPSPGQNVALIGHAGFVCPVLESLAWGEAAIYKPDGSGGSELITRVLWDGWMSLP